MRNNILATVVFYAVVSTLLGGYTIVMQDDVIAQLEYDLNVSRTAFKIQQNEIAQGLCLKNLGVLQ